MLLSEIGSRSLTGELASINARIESDDFSLTPFLRLVRLIVDSVSDTEICRAVFDLVSRTPTTHPPSRPLYNPDPPISHSSALQRGNEQTAVPRASLPLTCHIPSLALVHGDGITCPGTRQQVLKANRSPERTATAYCNWPGSRRVKKGPASIGKTD